MKLLRSRKGKKRKKYGSFRQVVAYVLVMCLTVGFFVSSFKVVNVSASSAMDRVTTYLNLAAGKQIKDLDGELNLTQDEMRFLGVYLSNFYIPFGTELGVTEDDSNSQTKKDMVKALQTELKFSDELAELFTDQVMGLSRSNSKVLEFRVGKKNSKLSEYEKVPNFKLNYWNFLRLMLCEDIDLTEGYLVPDDNDKPRGEKTVEKFNKEVYPNRVFGYEEDGEFHVVFDCNSASRSVFAQCLNSVDISKGYGFSFFDLTTQEIKDTDEIADAMKNLDKKDIYNMSIYGSKVCVDCFNNIILKGANHQYIMIPGCMNPYTWIPVDEKGEDRYKEIGEVGNYYNVTTFMGMGLADTDKLVEGGSVYDGPKKSLKKVRVGDSNISKDTKKKLEKIKENNNNNEEDSEDEDSSDKVFKEGTISAGKELYSKFVDLDGCSTIISWGKNTIIGLNILQADLDIIGDWTGWWSNDSTRDCDIYPLKLLRGSTEYDFSGSFFGFFGGDTRDTVVSAQEGFKNNNKNDYSYHASIYSDGIDYGNASLPAAGGKIGLLSSTTQNIGKIKLLDNIVLIDNLGQFHFDNSKDDVDLNSDGVIQFSHYLDEHGSSIKKLFEDWGKDSNNGFTNTYKDIQSGRLNTHMTSDQQGIVSVYTTYAIAGLYEDTAEAKKATIGKLGVRMNRDEMVNISNNPIDLPSDIADDIINNTIRDWVYYLLHPTKGLEYVRILITNKVSALLVGWHNDMVGTRSVGATTGTTLYKSNTGYVTSPDLSEIKWTSSLIQFYNNAIPFLIVGMLVTMVFAYLTGVMSLQKCLFGVVIFSCFLLLPVNLINGVVSVSNRVTQNLYGEKFTYWALVQQESYAEAIDEASSGDSYENYLVTLYATNNEVYNNQGSDSIVLKWQAPKKMASLMLTKDDKSLLDNLQSSSLIGLVLNNNAFSGESYLEGEENTYMYRSYIDIGNFSRYIYHGLLNKAQDSRTSVSSVISNLPKNLKNSINDMEVDYSEDRNNGYTNKNGDNSQDLSGQLRTIKPLSSSMYNDALSKKGKVKDLKITDFVGINQDVFNFSIAMFNASKNLNYKDELLINCKDGNKDDLKSYLNNYNDKDLSGLAAYSIMSESPFYYFSWSLYDQGMDTGSLASDGYRSLLLGQGEGGFFYNNQGNGELKDFMDMKSLFTYIIPYLKQGNDLVREWDDVYGISIYDGVPTEEGHWNDEDIKNSKELKQKYWHNINVARLYEIYTPWVDLMYDCSYAKPETITFLGKKYVVEDPINPATYPEDRPMVFSESEMSDYGLSRGDLTAVERKILECNQGMQESMYELLNYYNFKDLSLNTAAAINCTFKFNNIFSENGIFKDNINLYPQSFELADFSYDAFLRFILANSTNEDMTAEGDFYLNIVQRSSVMTAAVMIVLDALSQYVLPAFKIFFIIAVFISAILLILVTAFKVDPQQKFITKVLRGVITPMLKFLGITIGFAYVISLFMGTGNNAVTQTAKPSIALGDPVVVMLAMIALDIAAVVLYFFTIKSVVKDIKHNFKMAASFTGGIYGGVISAVGGFIAGRHSAKSSGGTSGGSKGNSYNDDGTGQESTRASRRASENAAEGKQDDEPRNNTRVNDAKRETFKENSSNDKVNNEEKKKDINDKTSKGVSKINKDSDDRGRDRRSRFSRNKVKEK